MSNLLLILVCLLLPFGEILRFDFNNGIAITSLDIVASINLIFVLFLYIRTKERFSLIVKSTLFFVAVAFISLLVSTFFFSLQEVVTGSLYLFRFIAFASLFITANHIKNKSKFIYFLFGSGILFGIFGVAQFFLYPNLRNLYYAGWDEHYYRLFSTFLDPNFAGIFLVLTFLLGFYLLLTQKLKKVNFYALLGTNALLLGCIFLTFSRSTFLSLFTGLLALFIALKQSRKYILLGIGISILAIVVIAFNYRFNEGTKLFRAASSLARVESLKDSWTIFIKNPLFGTGFNLYRYAGYKYSLSDGPNWETSHSGAGVENSFAFVAATTGILGLGAYLYLLYTIYKNALQNRKYTTFIIASIAALIVDSFFVNSLFFPSIMVWLWVMLGLTENT